MPPDPRAWLFDIAEAGQRLMRFISGKTWIDYRDDELLRAGVERQFEIVGEALSQLRRHSPELAAHISGALPLDAALERAKAATRQYAKRQYTWLRHQFPTDWPREERQLNSTVIDELAILLRQRLLTD